MLYGADMSPTRFSRYLLRTTDVGAAAAFYDTVLERRGDGILPLHTDAIARGARPHWLGHIRVRELGGIEALAARFIERGAIRLGPAPGIADFVVLRDPGGALVALSDSPTESSSGVVWHQLNTQDPGGAAENYATLFGWAFPAELDLGRLGRHQGFAFGAGEASIGIFSSVDGRPEVHEHWLFFFAVPSLDAALGRVLQHGGKAIGPIELPKGVRLAACDDPQGAAFGLIEPEDAVRLANELARLGSAPSRAAPVTRT